MLHRSPLKSHLAAPYTVASLVSILPTSATGWTSSLLLFFVLTPSLLPFLPFHFLLFIRPPPPLLLLFFSSMLDTSVWHVFPIRPVLRYRETGNHLQPQTHPDAGNWAETVAAQPWRQPQDTAQRRQPPQASFHQTLPTLPEWAGTCAGREMAGHALDLSEATSQQQGSGSWSMRIQESKHFRVRARWTWKFHHETLCSSLRLLTAPRR